MHRIDAEEAAAHAGEPHRVEVEHAVHGGATAGVDRRPDDGGVGVGEGGERSPAALAHEPREVGQRAALDERQHDAPVGAVDADDGDLRAAPRAERVRQRRRLAWLGATRERGRRLRDGEQQHGGGEKAPCAAPASHRSGDGHQQSRREHGGGEDGEAAQDEVAEHRPSAGDPTRRFVVGEAVARREEPEEEVECRRREPELAAQRAVGEARRSAVVVALAGAAAAQEPQQPQRQHRRAARQRSAGAINEQAPAEQHQRVPDADRVVARVEDGDDAAVEQRPLRAAERGGERASGAARRVVRAPRRSREPVRCSPMTKQARSSRAPRRASRLYSTRPLDDRASARSRMAARSADGRQRARE